ncbi:MAG: hypothetical protein ACLUOI_17150 [Eisenbergiella sp.]
MIKKKDWRENGRDIYGNRKEKTWSLNRMVVLIMMAGYAALLILLSCMDYLWRIIRTGAGKGRAGFWRRLRKA